MNMLMREPQSDMGGIMARIYNLSAKLNDADRQTVAGLLVKAGYRVYQGKEMLEGRKSNTIYIEFDLPGKERQNE